MYASHDAALVSLQSVGAQSGLHLDIRFCGSLDAIASLNAGRCTVAGFHALPHPAPGSTVQLAYQPLLRPGLHKIIGFARRRQGLVVARGNPLSIRSFGDLPRSGARYVNRALGTGTRLLAEDLLAQAELHPDDVDGWNSTEPSHAAVVQAVASGSADAGLAIEAAVQAHSLSFVPLVEEDYSLVCLKSVLDEPPVLALRALLASPAWVQALSTLAGYVPHRPGEVLSLTEQFPWWRFARRTPR